MSGILIVEDDADTREVLALALGMKGFLVSTAEDGSRGLEMAERLRPDLIIADLCMPNLSGVEMIELLRKQPRFSRVPILVLTAYGSEVVIDTIQAVGASRAVSKPLDYDILYDLIKDLLKEAKASAFAH
jgi:DNA-binding response OmpR family regulator